MRSDALGLFWEDRPPPPKQKAEKIKRTPPEPTWLRPDYLPGLEEALRMPIGIMDREEIIQAAMNRDRMLFDIECYSNYFLASFRSLNSGKVVFYESFNDTPLDTGGLEWAMRNFVLVGFNSLSYDLTISYLAVAGRPNEVLKQATNQIIVEERPKHEILRAYKVKPFPVDHIDLIEVAPLRASLKIYGGRLHVPRMQDLPFHPETVLTADQAAIVRWYNLNSDLTSTGFLHECLTEQLQLRTTLSNEIGMDLRSKSDAQIAEAVIATEYKNRTGVRAIKPVIPIGTSYRYRVPHFIKYQSSLLNWALGVIANANFMVADHGSIEMPPEVAALNLDINGSVYRMGIGGLHSSEKSITHVTDSQHILVDKDVTSYYPFIILNLGLYPEHLGPVFLAIFRNIVQRRIAAKRAGDKVTADSLKITINGCFGKLGSKHSIFYSPNLLIQVTLTGQLSLLMLIERLEIAGIHVVSANTDGIVIKCPRSAKNVMEAIVKQWEQDTGFETEDTVYKSLHSRDINNYIAIKEDGGVKTKGAYANPWSSKKATAERLHKNPTNTICVEAVHKFLIDGVAVSETIRNCRDITKFISVRTVKGGAVKVWADRTEFLGKAIRWYYAKDVEGELVYATSGNKVPRSDGAKPLMDLPATFPDDVDYNWYESEAADIFKKIGYSID